LHPCSLEYQLQFCKVLGEPSKILSMVSDLSSYSPLPCCIFAIQPIAHIISILRLGFICFICYCPICHTTIPKSSRLSFDGSGGHRPGSCSCHSESSIAYSVGQGSHGCSGGGNFSSHHDPSGCSLIGGTHQTIEFDLHGQYEVSSNSIDIESSTK
jgi:hypothetical protein